MQTPPVANVRAAFHSATAESSRAAPGKRDDLDDLGCHEMTDL